MDDQACPVCGERLALKGLSFFMVNVVVQRHMEARPECRLRVDFLPDGKHVEISPDTPPGP